MRKTKHDMHGAEIDLMTRVANGDAEAFGELYDRYAPRAMGLVVHILGNRRDAEEVLQETFWRIWRSAANYDASRATVTVWVLLIARSASIDTLRRRKREAGANEILKDNAASSENLIEASTHEILVDEVAAARRAFSQLPDDQRELLGLAFYRGMSHRQIASFKSLPVGTVKTRLRTGMIRLRGIIAGGSREVSTS